MYSAIASRLYSGQISSSVGYLDNLGNLAKSLGCSRQPERVDRVRCRVLVQALEGSMLKVETCKLVVNRC